MAGSGNKNQYAKTERKKTPDSTALFPAALFPEMRLPRHHVIVVEINKAPLRFLVQQGFMRHQQEGERLPFIRIRGMNVIKLGIGHKAVPLVKPQAAA